MHFDGNTATGAQYFEGICSSLASKMRQVPYSKVKVIQKKATTIR